MNPSKDEVIDHINHNTLDNREINLRKCTIKENNENRKGAKRTNSSNIRGVSFSKKQKKWIARIGVNYKNIWLGSFEDIKDAENTVIKARKEYFTHSIN